MRASRLTDILKVSRHWRHILQSSDVLEGGLASWSGSTFDLQGAERDVLESTARHIHAFRQGEPSCRLRINLNDGCGHVTFVGDTLIWSVVSLLDRTARAINVFNIKEWTLHTLVGDAREKIERLFASDKIVGFATSGTVCYVWSLQRLLKRRFRVPYPALFQSITCRGDTVACAAYLEGGALIYIWDYHSQMGRSFTISYDSPIFAYPTSA